MKRANKHICHSKVRGKTKHLKTSDMLEVYFTFSLLFSSHLPADNCLI